MRSLVVLMVLLMAVRIHAADGPDDDLADGPASGHSRRLKSIDDDIQLQATDPEEEPDDPIEPDDPYADDPDADSDTLPEDRPNVDPDAEEPPIAEPAELPLDRELPAKKKNPTLPNVLESPLKESPLKDPILDTDTQ